jgi:hypothetical protein
MHNSTVELQGKCRRIFYSKIDIPGGDAPSIKAGDIIAVASGGGAIASLSGDDLVIATYNDYDAPSRIGCIEEYYNPVPATKPLKIDLTKVAACCDAVDAHRTAEQAEADFVFATGIQLFGSESPTTVVLRHTLQVQEMYTRDKPSRTPDHDAIVQAQTDLEALCKTCADCCEQLLVTRDAAITFAGPEV